MDISRYLKNKSKPPKKSYKVGDCAVCGLELRWSREKLSSHKRSGNCIGQEPADLDLCEKVLSGSALNKRYLALKEQAQSMLNSAQMYSIVTDGWSNIRNEHLDEVAEQILRVIDEIGSQKCVSVVTDNASVIKAAWNIIERRKLHIFANGCVAHWMNLLVKDIVSIPYFAAILEDAVDYVKFVRGKQLLWSAFKTKSERVLVLPIGSKKCVSVVTDNASVMKAAWNIIERRKPHIFANGCADHWMNLLVKDIVSIPYFAAILEDAVDYVKFVRGKQLLCLPAATRWFTHYKCLESLADARTALYALANDEKVLDQLKMNASSDFRVKLQVFVDITNEKSFWLKVLELQKALEYPSNLIGKLEGDTTHLSRVYVGFKELIRHYSDEAFIENADLRQDLVDIAKERWSNLHTESMGFAVLLDPNHQDILWDENDKVDTIKQIKSHIQIMYRDLNEQVACTNELNRFLASWADIGDDEKQEYTLPAATVREYWSIYGKNKYPRLFRIAQRVFNVPTSSAASERIWKAFSFIHSKRRNRLKNETVEKLTYIYINSALLDTKDQRDYVTDEFGLEVEEDSDVIVIDDEVDDGVDAYEE
ncbi:hypothetical protein MP638_005994 [Amoeboaphelidium occidentale]|nr:hypothetical protein MP638_005994 [Amoeboaphelidium occidentale]